MTKNPRTNHATLLATLTAALALAICTTSAATAPPEGEESKANRKPPRPKLTLSREVTFLTEPLAADGLVDYPAALNAKLGQGVTPENNAAVPALRALGPSDGHDADAEFADLCKRVGLPLPPADTVYLVSIERFVTQLLEMPDRERAAIAKRIGVDANSLSEQAFNRTDWSKYLARCLHSPWSPKDEPVMAAWLDRISAPLDLLTQASKRPHLHIPLDSSKSWSGMLEFNTVSLNIPRVAAAFRARAMLLAGEGKHAAAWNDALAIKRWAKLVASGPFPLDQLVAIVIVNEANAVAAALMACADLDEKRLRETQAEWNAVEARPSIATALTLGERCFGLEAMNALHRVGYDPAWSESLESFEMIESPPSDARSTRLRRAIAGMFWDIDTAYAALNRHYDRMSEIAEMPDGRPRRAAALDFEDQLEKAGADRMNPFQWLSIAALDFAPRRIAFTRYIVATRLAPAMAPAIVGSLDSETQSNVQSTMTDIAFAMELYRATHSHYPARLQDLVPALLERVPTDTFGSGVYKYARQKDGGYTLHSVGRNGNDESGRTSAPIVNLKRKLTVANTDGELQNEYEETDADDLLIRIEGKRKS